MRTYNPVSFTTICREIFEHLLYDTFRPGDSCINQLLLINHEIFSASDMEVEVHEIFLDISKVLDKVWHDGLIFKLCQNDICGEMINTLEDVLRNRKKTIVLNGQCLSGVDIRADVPQRSILGPLLFLIYVNDLSNDINSKYILVADHRYLFYVVEDIDNSTNDLTII